MLKETGSSMGQCRKPQCNSQMAAGSAYCALHKAGPNVVLPSVPVSVAVRQARTPAPRAAAPHHRRRGAVDFGTTAPLLEGQAKNMQRMRFAHATHLAKRTTDQESLAPLIAAFHEIAQAPGFAKCLDDEVGWTNWSAWCDWAVRAIAPEMAMRPVAVEVRDLLRSKSLIAGMQDRHFADRYFLELSLYCDAAIERMDTSFVLGQASMVLGPILAPFMAVPAAAARAAGGAVASYATQAAVGLGKGLAEIGIKAGAKELVAPGSKQTTVRKYENLNPMRFTLAWLDYVTSQPEPRAAVDAIVREFGGDNGVRSLYAFLKSSNL